MKTREAAINDLAAGGISLRMMQEGMAAGVSHVASASPTPASEADGEEMAERMAVKQRLEDQQKQLEAQQAVLQKMAVSMEQSTATLQAMMHQAAEGKPGLVWREVSGRTGPRSG